MPSIILLQVCLVLKYGDVINIMDLGLRLLLTLFNDAWLETPAILDLLATLGSVHYQLTGLSGWVCIC